ncbi:putative membrane protein YeaQ/YmgE (transglycosylase-associated protein family) [Tamaricihabitans halophyticus]|uniref:Putative membrane protein YeaQ/YmgE (Transglycosylase-associated protein family) n=1 Tax=Tamaricihabitans halophyticus TaxID=1262583 RepID=A0A4R2R3J3_9PSEU|nr:GlsB/YeaQ/YmgE family stress response membrane protein [Tamaricihabitans halophyticus]TCP56597.1 putative membrane protein YeaQ/YmgE (transglycosylase-associated protein family) [Tamaricihabitans halophyticus]
MGPISWIIFGALAGWAANLVVGGRDRRPQGCILSVLVGVLGAALGGFIYTAATGRDLSFSFDFTSFGVAVLGAIGLLVVVRLVRGIGSGRGSNRS